MFQLGSRAQRSARTALVIVTNDLLRASNNGAVSILVLLDLSAALDTYLSDRHQFAHVNVVSSLYNRGSHGVPQGSVFGPILFSL